MLGHRLSFSLSLESWAVLPSTIIGYIMLPKMLKPWSSLDYRSG